MVLHGSAGVVEAPEPPQRPKWLKWLVPALALAVGVPVAAAVGIAVWVVMSIWGYYHPFDAPDAPTVPPLAHVLDSNSREGDDFDSPSSSKSIRFEVEDLSREDLLSFYRSTYSPGNDWREGRASGRDLLCLVRRDWDFADVVQLRLRNQRRNSVPSLPRVPRKQYEIAMTRVFPVDVPC